MTQLPLFQHQVERPRLDPAQPYRERLAHLLAGDLDFHEADSTYATHALHAFPAKFPPQLPRLFIRELTKPDDVVFDPMVGSGTTLVEAVLAGRRAVGSDIDPLALRLCRVKVTPLPLDEVIRFGVAVCRQAERMVQEQPAQVEALVQQRFDDRTRAFVEYWFYPRTILELMALVTAIEAIEPEDVRAFLEVTFSGIIVTKSGGVSRARDLAHTRPHRVLDKPPRSAFEAFRQRLRKNVEALAALAHCAPRVELYEADAQALPLEDESVDLIVTSPPYASNAIDYMRAHKFSLVWFGYPLDTLTAVRKAYIGGESVANFHFEELPPLADEVVKRIGKKDEKKARVLHRYYSEMTRTLKEMYRVLKPAKAAIVVVGTSVMRGEDTLTHKCLAAIGEAIGFDVTGIGVRRLDRNRRMMPARHGKKETRIEHRMHEEYVLGLYKPGYIHTLVENRRLRDISDLPFDLIL